MRKVIVVLVVLGLLAIPVYAAMTTIRYTLPPDEDMCVECPGRNTGLWAMRFGARKVIFKCVKVSRRKGGGRSCSLAWDAVFRLRRGERLIVKAGGKERLLGVYNWMPHVFEVYNW